MRSSRVIALAFGLLAGQSSPAQSVPSVPSGIVREIEFVGLQRIFPGALRGALTSREGELLDPARVEADVRALNRLGWFDDIRAEVELLPAIVSGDALEDSPLPAGAAMRLVFVVAERPFLAQVEFRGSRALAKERITAVLAEQGISLRLASPANRAEAWRAAHAIERALEESGYPQARVKVRLQDVPRAAVRALFEIQDGPRIRVERVVFAGNTAFSGGKLRGQMKRIAPGARFAGLRGKAVYTPERLAEDLDRLQEYYRNHGYPEARLGGPHVELVERKARRGLPWPRKQTHPAFAITIPVEPGPFYRVESTEVEGAPPGLRASFERALRDLTPQAIYSQEKLLRLREQLSRLAAREAGRDGARVEVEVVPHFNRSAGTVRVAFRVRDVEPYMVRRIRFAGHHRFSDRYYRRRVLLKEGEPFDPQRLERGLAQLARAGYIRPLERRNLQVHLDQATRAADIAIRVQEIGRQRISLVGGASGFGSTLGIVYNVFDLLGGEELLTGHLEGGPSTVTALLGIAKEGLFGTRASLGLSLFQNFIRPNLPGTSGRERIFTARSSGFLLNGNYALSSSDALGVSYEVSRNSSEIFRPLPSGISGLPGNSLSTGNARRSLGLDWTRESASAARQSERRLDTAASVSGGWLGGDEKLLRSSLEYASFFADPFTQGRNAWVYRGLVAGVSSYGGASLPLQERLFAGDQLLRGFRAGELAPYALATAQNAGGISTTLAPARLGGQAAGANLVTAVNGEYRVPIEPGSGTEAVVFLDVGTGWLLPQWLGSVRPRLVAGTNGPLRASTGLELRFPLPVVRQIVRVHYAVNPLRLAGPLALPDGTSFRPRDRRSAWGWAFGSLF